MAIETKPGIPMTKSAIPERRRWVFTTREKGKNFQITLKYRPDDDEGHPKPGITLRPVNGIFDIRDPKVAEMMMHPACMGMNKLTLLSEEVVEVMRKDGNLN